MWKNRFAGKEKYVGYEDNVKMANYYLFKI